MSIPLSKMIFPKTKFTPNVIGLYFQRLIQSTAIGLLGVFMPIFLYEKFNFSLQSVMLFYIIGFSLYVLTVQPGARLMSRLGLKMSMILSTPFLIGYYWVLYFVADNPWRLLLWAIAVLNIFRMLYWVPYHTEFAKFTDRMNRGKQIGFLASITSIIGILTPIISGFVIDRFGFQSLFVIVMILLGLSFFPLIVTKQVKEKFSFGYFETFKLLFTKRRRILMAYGAEGAEAAVGLVIWPIFMYQIFEGNYLEIGAVSTLVIFATVITRLLVGKYTDKMPKRKLLHWGTFVYAIGWVFKVFVQTGYDLFLASTYHNLAKAVMRTPFDALTYEQMADAGHYVDEMSVFREISLNLGRTITFVALLLLVSIIGLNTIFWLGAIFALLINFL